MKIANDLFYELYKSITDKFAAFYEEKHGTKPNITQIFELQGFDQKDDTLRKAMLEDKDIMAELNRINEGKEEHEHFTPSARYLYNKKNQLDKAPGTTENVTINAPYDRLLFLYLGYNSLKEYEENRQKHFIHYKGYYYSYKKHEVFAYDLRINYDQKPNVQGVDPKLLQFSVEEQGFHDNNKNPLYIGYGYLLEGKSHIIMWDRDGTDKLRMILDSGDNPEDNPVMRGALFAISSYQGHPLANIETVVVKENYCKEGDILRIKRYLFLHRYNFRINSNPLNLKRMDAKNVSVDVIRNFVGAWRVLRFSRQGKELINSILYVRDDYKIICFTNSYEQENLNEQVCLPNVTIDAELNTRTICLNCFPKEGANIISSLMIKHPDSSHLEVTGGVITFVGKDNGFPSMGAVALGKDPQLEQKIKSSENLSQDIKKELWTLEQIEDKIETDTVIKMTHKMLIEIENENNKLDNTQS